MSRPLNNDVFRAIAHPARRRIIELLVARNHRSAGEIAGEFEMTRPAISQHLRVLRTVGVIAERQKGTRLLYALQPRAFARILRWIDGCAQRSRGRAR